MNLAAELGPEVSSSERDQRWIVWALGAASFAAVLIANASGISIGDDGVGYQAIADSLARGDGYGYFLERPVTVWPPIWPGLMALVSRLTPLGTVGAAVLLNALVSVGVVILGNKLLRKVVASERIVLLGTIVLALGPATVGLGHVLMTDMAFALVVMTWMLVLTRFWENGSIADLVIAAMLAWLAFGVRYVGLVLIAIGGLWILLDTRSKVVERVRNGLLYGVVSVIAPAVWMLRNYNIDETFTGERHTSARGFIDNGFDLTATIGRFLVPGVANGATKIWSAIGVVASITAVVGLWMVLSKRPSGTEPPADPDAAGDVPTGGSDSVGGLRQVVSRGYGLLGTPIGLIGMFACLYMAYMLYVRTTTALNQLDLRLLFPAYFPLLVVVLAALDRLSDPKGGSLSRPAYSAVHLWAAANLCAGLVGMVAFGMGHPYFPGDYAADTFVEVRDNPALNAVPAGCTNYSNLPNALYPRLDSKWSPQRTALESTDPTDDLARLERSSAKHKSCLVWIDEDPEYGHLWPLHDLRQRLDLTRLAGHGDVTVYLITPQR